MERNEWIVDFLTGKKVKKSDLEDFFTIENQENKITINNINDKEIIYRTDLFSYTVKLSSVPKCSTMYKISSVVVA